MSTRFFLTAKITKKVFAILCIIVISIFLMPSESYSSTPSAMAWRSFQRGNQLKEAGNFTEALQEFLEAVGHMPNNASYQRAVAETLYRLNRFDDASEAFAREAQIRRANGEIQAALVLEQRSNNLRSELQVFVLREVSRIPPAGKQLALYEPPAGLYFGAYVEQDRNIGRNNQAHFNTLSGRTHAVFFNYHPYGMPFPHNWARIAREAGAAIHIALEPERGLSFVQDNEYLRQFARQAYAAQVPVFLRFASEMNGNWVAWHGNPRLYIEKWRLVTRVMREEAPNVAMVWTPNSVPIHNINDYYPGDDYVDWVGVNLYSVAYFDGDRNRPAYHVNPLDLIRPIYDMYADRKPIQMSEFGATHFTAATNQDVTDFALTKMRQLYHGVNMLMPRVKNINWFSMNTIAKAQDPSRRLNNFSLTENTRLMNAYRDMLGYPYFLERVANGPFAADPETVSVPVPLSEAVVLEGMITLQSWAKIYDPFISRVEYRLNGKLIAGPQTLPYSITIDTGKLTNGRQLLAVTIYCSQGKPFVTRNMSFTTTGGLARQYRTIEFRVGETKALIDGYEVDKTSPSRLINSQTFVPLRFVSEKFGADVAWDRGLITVKKGENVIRLRANDMNAEINGESVKLSQPPQLISGVAFVPLRFVSENLGAEIIIKNGLITVRVKL